MSEIVCVLAEKSGKIFRIKKEKEDLKTGEFCIIESELGGDLAVVIDISREVCEHSKCKKDVVKVIRKASDEDREKFDWLKRKEK